MVLKDYEKLYNQTDIYLEEKLLLKGLKNIGEYYE